MLEKLKKEIYYNLQVLFAEAAVDEIADDIESYKAKLTQIAAIAKILNISTEITTVTINLNEIIQDVEV